MPVIERSREQQEYERELELEDQARYDDGQAARRDHELTLANGRHKRDVDIARLKHATAPRQAAITRVLVAVVKMPALVILALMIPILVLKGREVPRAIEEFVTL